MIQGIFDHNKQTVTGPLKLPEERQTHNLVGPAFSTGCMGSWMSSKTKVMCRSCIYSLSSLNSVFSHGMRSHLHGYVLSIDCMRGVHVFLKHSSQYRRASPAAAARVCFLFCFCY